MVRAVDDGVKFACHPNAGAPGAPSTARLAETPSRREVSTAQIVQSITRGIE